MPLLAAAAVVLLALFVVSYLIKDSLLRRLLSLSGLLIFFLFGAGWMYGSLSRTAYPFSETEAVYRAVVVENPVEKERSLLCASEISGRRVLLYFPKDSASSGVRRGDELFVSARISLPRNGGNPDEFDYRTYLLHRGVSGTGYVAGGHWRLVEHRPGRTLRQVASDYRQKILDQYRRLGFAGDEFSVLSALTAGYKDELHEDIRESFAVSGASHVLALSGLHIGFLSGLLLFLLNGITGKTRSSLWLKTLVVLTVLWGFAFLTGLSPSVVRSVIMFSLPAFSILRGEKMFSLNSLISAAFIMLLFSPAWLFDVGFQLSFSAVAAILLIQPRLYNMLSVKGKAAKWAWGTVTTSVAAQVGVTPLVLFYFSRFSTHFLLTNLLVLLPVAFIMYGAVFMLLFTPFPAIQSLLVYPVKWLLIALNASVRRVEQLPFASLDGIWLSVTNVALLYIMLLLLISYASLRRTKYLLGFLTCLLLFTAHRTWQLMENTPGDSIAFYNVRHAPAVHCISSDGSSWLVYADSLPASRQLPRSLSGYWNRLRLSEPAVVTGDRAEGPFRRVGNVIAFGGRRICIINDNTWRNYESEGSFPIDYLYLCEGYGGNAEPLTKLFPAKAVVLDASLPAYRREALIRECETLELPCYSLAEGASIFSVFEGV